MMFPSFGFESISILILFIVLFRHYVILRKYKEQKISKEALEQENVSIKSELEKAKALATEQNFQIKYLEKIQLDSKNIQETHLNAAKIALLDVGKELNKELLNQHKLENDQNKKLVDQNISKVNVEFVKIANIVQSLGDQFVKSQKSMGVIQNALLNPTGAGQLAEITLENVLKHSGLVKDIDFFIQPQFTNDNNKKLRPDAVVKTSSSIIIIDAKSSASLLMKNSEDSLAEFMKAMSHHLKSLTSKEYANFITEFTKVSNGLQNELFRTMMIMFVPTEVLVEKIMDADNGFMNKCWENGVYITGPVGLMNILALSKIEIQESEKAKNYELIISEIQKLMDSLGILTEHASKFGSSIQSVVSQYDKFVASFNRNFLAKARSIQKLGMNIKKNNIALKRYQLITTSEILDSDSDDLKDDKSSENEENPRLVI